MGNLISNSNQEQKHEDVKLDIKSESNHYKNMTYGKLCEILEYNILNNINDPLLEKQIYVMNNKIIEQNRQKMIKCN